MAKIDGSDVQTQMTPAGQTGLAPQGQSLNQWLTAMEPEIKRALPAHMKADRFLRVVLTTLRLNPKLSACNPASFVAAMMTSAQLGLEVNTPLGQAFIIPYGKEAQFQIGYKGILDLAYRTKEYQMIYAMEVYANDKFEFEYGLEPKLIHKPDKEPAGEPIYYYAVYHLANGGKAFRAWTKEKVVAHAKKFSASYKKGGDTPWKTDFDSMAKKTVLIDLLKYAPKSIEISQAFALDETVRSGLDEDMSMAPIIDIAPVEEEVKDTPQDAPDVKQEPPGATEEANQGDNPSDDLDEKEIKDSLQNFEFSE